ncbi:SGNH/GDSL hydrolase family protein [Asticcacaulis sp. AND118]|uniref:SGNH/GDSL hydrolase family protein n=1 Tax=Asticcacaulis sp. AND118 TaxID=2840468 RepID=UPI001CFF8F9B|nr:SGNH/GDSL hydrolase family protein [Asticcacaulis sp. AND118]UDF04872.1 GDSL-type esterase/lipase family protein [Asticcacaulis sp. AND118]
MKTVLTALSLGLCFSATVASADTLPLHNGGRTAAPAYTHQWPGVYFETTTASKSVTLSFDDSINIYKLYLNGEVVKVIEKPGKATVRFDSPSANAVDVYRLEKITESQGQTGRFLGFSADKPAALTARTRQIEFIGDSYTVGYGNTSPKRECTTDEVWATTDTSQAFGPLTAKLYDADYQINAFSGRGIVRNYNGFQGDTLPTLYAHTLFDGKSLYDDKSWKPRIIVIGLGTNDFSTALNPGEKWKSRDALQADYRDTYVAFVKRLRAKNPQAHFILMASDQANGEIRDQVTQVAKTLKAGGETRLDTIYFDGLDFGGCHFHPSLADDRKLSRLLKDWIDSHPQVWQGR